ncbi:MAG: hypothetical protein DRQ60_08400 [Gammaproteobacteria bacterium]|nr:MAG: hypothetical protein DRQ60_08400 [Gammaproteobacteria bacterium]
MERSRSLKKLFADASDHQLAEIIAKAAQLNSLEQRIFDNLPQTLRSELELATIEEQTLTLICSSSLIASRLRFMETELLAKLNRDTRISTLLQIRVIVRRDWSQDQPLRSQEKRGTGRTISTASALLIKQTSTIVNNPRLAEALKKLARHTDLPD